jgi:hypothetical protein
MHEHVNTVQIFLYPMLPPSGRILPVSDSHDLPRSPAGKSSFKMMRSTQHWWKDARHPQCSISTVLHIRSAPHPQCSTSAVLHIRSAPHPQCSTSAVLHIRSAPHPQCSTSTVLHIHRNLKHTPASKTRNEARENLKSNVFPEIGEHVI